MAEAFGIMLGKGVIDALSSGSHASGMVNSKAIESMKAIGYDLGSHISKSLKDIPQVRYDYVVTMGCGDACPIVRAKNRENWEIPDPKHLEMDQFNAVRDMIKKKVIRLIETIKSSF